ncbi:hypothetical protein L195_g029674 [Trifolium pratense]|uniref:RNase H type-1 domain-containing protein n=1 Tax=Trifolium pratense TaxID=57577 RepID=A0A2K3L5G3_TRIPR|nr:hypothetical protein L195_g029668 [Trifolium pratense]PNX73769.1 hypothetical protein L195_g029674 [Trifolium pratense]
MLAANTRWDLVPHRIYRKPNRQTQQTRTVQHSVIWEKPHDGWLKINVDARLFEHQGTTITACCVRNSNGEFQGAQTRKYTSNMSILEGEGMALFRCCEVSYPKRTLKS